jgi:hypothetical protein
LKKIPDEKHAVQRLDLGDQGGHIHRDQPGQGFEREAFEPTLHVAKVFVTEHLPSPS